MHDNFFAEGVSQQLILLLCHPYQHEDIALVTLATPVPASMAKTVRPICLATGSESYVGRMGTVVGWGSLYENGPQPDTLQELTMEIWDNDKCRTTYGNQAPGGIISSMLCAGQKGKDSCSVSDCHTGWIG